MRRLCVYCGAASGSDPVFKELAIELGNKLVSSGFELVYGGGHVGLMGALADAVLEAGGKVIGVIPKDLVAKELAHRGLTELKIVSSMHERKAVMAHLADGFLAIPGGYGTLEEFCEVLTGSMLGLHKKPCGILNINGYYDHLIEFFDTGVRYEFIRAEHRSLVLVANSVEDSLELIKNFVHTVPERWADGVVKYD